MDKARSKYRNAAAKMNNALFALLKDKSFPEITVKEICERAGVNRSTFYAHYENTYELLEETQNNLVGECFKSFELPDMDIEKLSADDTIFINTAYLMPYLEFIKNNKAVFKVYMDNLNNFRPLDVYNYMVDKVFVPVLKKNGVTDKTAINYMAKYYLTGVNAIVTEWLDGDCAEDIGYICEIIITCVRPIR